MSSHSHPMSDPVASALERRRRRYPSKAEQEPTHARHPALRTQRARALNAACLLTALTLAGAAAEVDATGVPAIDPMVWSAPATLPEPTSPLDEQKYRKRLGELLAQVDIAGLEASTKPIAGQELFDLVPGGQGEKLGMALGDIVVAVNDEHPRFHQDFRPDRSKVDTLELWSSTAGLHRVQVQPGLIGMSQHPVWFPELGYLRSAARAPAWDREVVAAALAFRTDPDLALAALAHARISGYDGIYLRPLQACSCFNAGRYAEALALAAASILQLPKAERVEAIMAMYGAAYRDFKLPEAQSVLERAPDWHMDTDGFAPYLRDHQGILAHQGGFPHPLAFSPGTPSYDLAHLVRCTDHDHADATGDFAEVLEGNGAMSWDPPRDKSMGFKVSFPPVKWFEITITFAVSFAVFKDVNSFGGIILDHPSDHDVLRDGWVDYGERTYAESFTAQREVAVCLYGIPRSHSPLLDPGGAARRHTLHLAVRDGIVESTLDGRPHCYAPLLGGDQDLALYFHIVGSHFGLIRLAVVSHDPQPPPGWKALEARPPVAGPKQTADDF